MDSLESEFIAEEEQAALNAEFCGDAKSREARAMSSKQTAACAPLDEWENEPLDEPSSARQEGQSV